MAGLNKLGVRRLWPYLLGFAALWLAMLASGIHPTISGVVAALTISGPGYRLTAARMQEVLVDITDGTFAALGVRHPVAGGEKRCHQFPIRRTEVAHSGYRDHERAGAPDRVGDPPLRAGQIAQIL